MAPQTFRSCMAEEWRNRSLTMHVALTLVGAVTILLTTALFTQHMPAVSMVITALVMGFGIDVGQIFALARTRRRQQRALNYLPPNPL